MTHAEKNNQIAEKASNIIAENFHLIKGIDKDSLELSIFHSQDGIDFALSLVKLETLAGKFHTATLFQDMEIIPRQKVVVRFNNAWLEQAEYIPKDVSDIKSAYIKTKNELQRMSEDLIWQD